MRAGIYHAFNGGVMLLTVHESHFSFLLPPAFHCLAGCGGFALWNGFCYICLHDLILPLFRSIFDFFSLFFFSCSRSLWMH